MTELNYNITEETTDEVIDEIIAWERWYEDAQDLFRADYEADEEEFRRVNNENLENCDWKGE